MQTKSGFTLIEILVSISVIALLTALLLPAVQSARESARRMKCASNFSSVGIAVQNYVSSYTHFPSGIITWSGYSETGDHLVSVSYSMFARILPYLEQRPLYDSINFEVSVIEPEDPAKYHPHPHVFANSTAHVVLLDVLLCPSDTSLQSRFSAGTNIRSNSGSLPHTYPYDNARLAGPATVIHVYVDGMYNARHGSSLSSVTDGLSNTSLASEKLRGSDSAPIFDPRRHFLKLHEPADYRISSDDFMKSCFDPNASFDEFIPRSGLTWLLGSTTSTTYNHVSGINMAHGDCVAGGQSEFVNMTSARSQHPGGVNVCMADGSVRFVRNGVALPVWRAIGSKAGGEVISSNDY
jgi:prepilin-type N-terminal cleavage/methylation domain-containing protein/prepilin-type processing-associated H-X9-DG protein